MSKTGQHVEKKKVNIKLIIILAAVLLFAAGLILFFVLSGGESNDPSVDVSDTNGTADVSNEDLTPEPEPVPEPEPESDPEPVPEPEVIYTNPLTGIVVEEDVSHKRPYAVMINNIKKSLPQYGVNSADIIFEVPVEGGITRMMALYQDISSVDIIGSIRSSRPYYLDIVQGFDAIYVHAGGSNNAYNDIDRYDIDNIDGVNGANVKDVFYRDSWRRKNLGYEHSLMAVTEEVSKYAADHEFRLEHDEGYKCNFEFKEDVILEGESALFADVFMTSYKNTEFTYDAETDEYLLSQYKTEYIDAGNESRVSVKNIIVIFAETKVVDSKGRLRITLTGDGDGYFICGGKYIPIEWSKESSTDNFVFKDINGQTITFESGKTYVCVCSAKDGLVSFE